MDRAPRERRTAGRGAAHSRGGPGHRSITRRTHSGPGARHCQVSAMLSGMGAASARRLEGVKAVNESLLQLGLVAVLVVLNAGFAGSEMALISLREGQLQRL